MIVAALWRYPVKSLRGESLESASLLADGLAGDRLASVQGPNGQLTALTKHALLGLQGGIGPAGEPLVEGDPWEGEAAALAIREAAGEDARLVTNAAGARFHDEAPILVATDGALSVIGADRRRFRANVVVTGVEGVAEAGWIGRALRMGEVRLRVASRCERCLMTTIDPDTLELDPGVLRRVRAELEASMGVYCEVVEPGQIAVGDPVELV